MQKEKFSNQLRRLIDHLGITQEEMGRRLGVSRNMVSMMLRTDKEVLPSRSVKMHFDNEWTAAFAQEDVDEDLGFYLSHPDEKGYFGKGKVCLKTAREAVGLSQEQAANDCYMDLERYRAIEEGRMPLSSMHLFVICRVLNVDPDDLMDRPGDELPRDKIGLVPLLPMAECGVDMEANNWERVYQDFFVQNIRDAKAFAIIVEGDSMSPVFASKDVAVVTPGKPLKNGVPVLARLREAHDNLKEGTVMLKLYQAFGDVVTLYSHNPAFSPATFSRSDFNWIYPVAQVTKTFD